jgi:hypothetical protein
MSAPNYSCHANEMSNIMVICYVTCFKSTQDRWVRHLACFKNRKRLVPPSIQLQQRKK